MFICCSQGRVLLALLLAGEILLISSTITFWQGDSMNGNLPFVTMNVFKCSLLPGLLLWQSLLTSGELCSEGWFEVILEWSGDWNFELAG